MGRECAAGAAGLCGNHAGALGAEEDRAPDEVLETAATAAAESAQAALLHAQAILHAERPWMLVTVAPSPSIRERVHRGRDESWAQPGAGCGNG